MKYNGQEVDLITDGYWPKGETLICSDDGKTWLEEKVFFLRDGHAIFDEKENGTCWTNYAYWALLPAKPAPRRLTNREVAKLCKKGWDTADGEWIYLHWHYKKEYENDPTAQGVTLRAPDSDEWLEPTSDLLEVDA